MRVFFFLAMLFSAVNFVAAVLQGFEVMEPDMGRDPLARGFGWFAMAWFFKERQGDE